MKVVVQHSYNLTQDKSSMTSCFVSESNLIWVMGFIREKEGLENNSYYIILYNASNIEVDLISYKFNTLPYYDRAFFKIIHLSCLKLNIDDSL